MNIEINDIIQLTHTFKYTASPSDNSPAIEVSIHLKGDATLPDLVQQFEYYLKACSFVLPEDSHLDFVPNDTGVPAKQH